MDVNTPLIPPSVSTGWQIIDFLDVMPGNGYVISFTMDLWKGSSTIEFLLHDCSYQGTSATGTSYHCNPRGGVFNMPNTGLNTVSYSNTGVSFGVGDYLGLYFPGGISDTNYPMTKTGQLGRQPGNYAFYTGSGTGNSYIDASNNATVPVTWYLCIGNSPCTISTCSAVTLTNGIVTYSQVWPSTAPPYAMGTVATFTCNPSYTLIGSGTSICLEPSYVFTVPSCALMCTAVTLSNGAVSYSSGGSGPFTTGTIATFTCDYGYAMSGSSTSTCTSNATMTTFIVPTCTRITCPSVTLNNGFISYSTTGPSPYFYGTIASYTCATGYELSGPISSTCDTSYTFTPSPPTCIYITCPTITIPNGGVTYSSGGSGPFGYGTVATFTCLSNNIMSGSSTSTCLSTTGFVAPTCTPITCPGVTLTSGTVTYSQPSASPTFYIYNIGTVATFQCDSPLILSGSSTSNCTSSGIFTVPLCSGTIVTCPAVTIANGAVSYVPYTSGQTIFTYNTIASFSCSLGYALSGSGQSSCTSSGFIVPTCVPITCPSVTILNGIVTYTPIGSSPYPYNTIASFSCHTNYIFSSTSFYDGSISKLSTNIAISTCTTGIFTTPTCVYPDIYSFYGIQKKEIRLTGAKPDEYYSLLSNPYFYMNIHLTYLGTSPSGGCYVTWCPCWYRPQSYIDRIGLILVDGTNITAIANSYNIGPTVLMNGVPIISNTFIPFSGLNMYPSLSNSYIHYTTTGTPAAGRLLSIVLGPLILSFYHSDQFFNLVPTINSTMMITIGQTYTIIPTSLSIGAANILTNTVRSIYGISSITELPNNVIALHGLLGQSWLNVQYTNMNNLNNAIQGVISDYQVSTLWSGSFAYSVSTF